LAQGYLLLANRTAPLGETLIRFFSYFTILTNTLAAVYFTVRATGNKWLRSPGALTAIAVYIFIVGAVYQVLLRHIWAPQGLQKVVDDLLHTVNPLLVFFYWFRYEEKSEVKYTQIGKWLLYPLVYLAYILVRGQESGFYPYPFVDVTTIGWQQTLLNALGLLLCFLAVSAILIFAGRLVSAKKRWPQATR